MTIWPQHLPITLVAAGLFYRVTPGNCSTVVLANQSNIFGVFWLWLRI